MWIDVLTSQHHANRPQYDLTGIMVVLPDPALYPGPYDVHWSVHLKAVGEQHCNRHKDLRGKSQTGKKVLKLMLG